MAITGPGSYIPTLDEFIPHWTLANAALGVAGPIVVGGTTSLAIMTGFRATLLTQQAAVETARNGVENARALLEETKGRLLAILNQFNARLESEGAPQRFLDMRPKAFSISSGMGKIVQPLDDLVDVWTRYESEFSEISLGTAGVILGDVQSDLADLKAMYGTAGGADMAVAMARAQRNETQEKIYTALKQYRKRIESDFQEGTAIYDTLPRLTPLPGATPDAVELSGAYGPGEAESTLEWSAVTDASVTSLELRATTGPEFDAEDESLLATFSPADPRTWTGTFGLGVPGAMASFKMFSLTAEGNEHGSNKATVQRPYGT